MRVADFFTVLGVGDWGDFAFEVGLEWDFESAQQGVCEVCYQAGLEDVGAF